MRTKEEMGKKLNDLLEKSYDAEKNYRTASEKVRNERLKTFFREKSEERKRFIKELREEITGYGQVPDDGGSAGGNLQRSWMNLKSALSSNKEKTVLDEFLKGEKKALKDYEEITRENDLPPTLSNKLNRQRQDIQASINKEKMYEQMFD